MTVATTPRTKRERIHGFDLIRLISFFVVAFYHFMQDVFHGHETEFYGIALHDSIFKYSMYQFERALASSGHILLFLSMILVAIAQKSVGQILRFAIFLIAAWLLFVWSDSDFVGFTPAWDIHPLLFVGLITIVCIEAISPKLIGPLAVFGFLLTCFNFYDWPVFQSLNIYLRSALVGDCRYSVSSWPILPWLGFLYFGYGVGVWLRNNRFRESARHMQKPEIAVWAVVLGLACFHVGSYYAILLEQWECKAFTLTPIDFYSDFVFVLFAIRVSLLASVDRFLQRAIPWVRSLNVSKNFFLAYALQYAMAMAIARIWGDELRASPQLFMWTGIAMLPMSEVIVYVAEKLGARKLFKGPNPTPRA